MEQPHIAEGRGRGPVAHVEALVATAQRRIFPLGAEVPPQVLFQPTLPTFGPLAMVLLRLAGPFLAAVRSFCNSPSTAENEPFQVIQHVSMFGRMLDPGLNSLLMV